MYWVNFNSKYTEQAKRTLDSKRVLDRKQKTQAKRRYGEEIDNAEKAGGISSGIPSRNESCRILDRKQQGEDRFRSIEISSIRVPQATVRSPRLQ